MIRAIALAGIVVSFAVTAPHANGSTHIDLLAVHLQKQTETLYAECNLHYRHTLSGRHLINDAAKLHAQARHLHIVAHHSPSIVHLRKDLVQIRQLYNHMQGVLREVEYGATHGHGSVVGRTGHVHVLISQIGGTILQLWGNVYPQPYQIHVGYGHVGHNQGHHNHGHSGHYNSGYRVTRVPVQVTPKSKPKNQNNHRNFGNAKPRFKYPN